MSEKKSILHHDYEEPLSVDAMSRILKMDRRTVKKVIEANNIDPVDHVGTFPVYDVKAVRTACEKHKEEKPKGNSAEEYLKHKARLTQMKADIATMDRDARRGKFVESNIIQKILFDIHGNFRAKILALPGKAGPKVEGKTKISEIVEVLTDEVHECLKEIANHDPSEIIEKCVQEYIQTNHPDDESSSEADSESVGGSEPSSVQRK